MNEQNIGTLLERVATLEEENENLQSELAKLAEQLYSAIPFRGINST